MEVIAFLIQYFKISLTYGARMLRLSFSFSPHAHDVIDGVREDGSQRNRIAVPLPLLRSPQRCQTAKTGAGVRAPPPLPLFPKREEK